VWHCEDLAEITSCNDGRFSFLLAPLTLILLGAMVEENGNFVNSDKERGGNKTKKMEE
jgi:hypothetical protein